MDQEKQEQLKKGPFSEWGFDAEGIVANAQRMVKVNDNSHSKFVDLLTHLVVVRSLRQKRTAQLAQRPSCTAWGRGAPY